MRANSPLYVFFFSLFTGALRANVHFRQRCVTAHGSCDWRAIGCADKAVHFSKSHKQTYYVYVHIVMWDTFKNFEITKSYSLETWIIFDLLWFFDNELCQKTMIIKSILSVVNVFIKCLGANKCTAFLHSTLIWIHQVTSTRLLPCVQ